MNAEEMAAHAHRAKAADESTLVERVEGLEKYLAAMYEQVESNTSAIGRVGSRLARAEKHVGLPSTDV